jgi:hypothetical protein
MHQTEPVFREHGQDELYALAASVAPQPATQSTDMFEGIVEDYKTSGLETQAIPSPGQ